MTSPPPGPYTLRPALPSDMPTIVHRHGTLYSKEQGYRADLAAGVAKTILDDFTSNHDPASERCWVAENNNNNNSDNNSEDRFIGCVLLVHDKSEESYKCAKLRLLLVEPSARGLGLGGELIRQCTRFARGAGYERIRLWTNSGLTGARRLYVKEGYRMVREEEDQTFGVTVQAEFWELVL
ncbi:GNAT family N-acetyltransferase [Aspergillus mulundensis]|uniref:N-acetyltransferase domain-containing protein n=1 Tax=Aspergillus mulundensis TaxID=1810919 RepID=A0A3D8S522_9EURO|nr:hypothetical protein DSM5745_04847 [Aspergillus mulundensis]RDW81290.1 hypothetical protein DSM5745_04847 [Aspergillus mulundensis]